MLSINSGRLLGLIEKNRGRGQELLEKLQIIKEEETSSRMLIGNPNNDFSSRNFSQDQNNVNNFHQ
jgi:hypothetical protein